MNEATNETIEDKIRDVLLAELQRQVGEGVRADQDGKVQINGAINIDDLALAITGAIAGGP